MKKHSNAFLTLVNHAKALIKETTIETVANRLNRNENFVLIDVREDREWEIGHLPNAIHLGKGVIERDIEKQVPDRTTHLILYCGGGYRSALAAESLQRMGYENVESMDGGFSAWKESGLPIEP